MHVFVECKSASSSIGSVYEAPVDAEIKMSDSYASHVGGAPSGPVTKLINALLGCFIAYLLMRFEKPPRTRMAN